ncbi:universal stress protein [Halobacteria archaeon AArc-m2/3/4]|uniref:Universal stress protein n=1 Tax=Natronoglomus mannanivorans TaxID=2979990 RepID=A0AAP3E4V3_9EURY|nr:universal stress protein [Halobacteria archaeon AArc-xg1-1]MCU4973917.1 universal stress protein [Halobacteria archaeon AArc-m2/3/4]
MFQEILVATDGSDLATLSAEQGLAVAKTFDATIHAVSVVETADDGDLESVSEERRDDCRHFVDAIEADAIDRDVDVVTAVRAGRPSRELLAYADENEVDLVVVGTHGRTGIRRWIMGSVATSVLRDARCPTLTVNASVTSVPRAFDDILVATDGRPGADAAIDRGLDLAEAYGATVHAVSVVDDTHSHMRVVLDEFERVSEESTAEITTRATERGVNAVSAVERGLPHETLVAYASDHDVDLVVIGTESRSGLERLVIGSVSQRVVCEAPVPVLTVRAGLA